MGETTKESSYEPVGLKIDETENIEMNIVHFCRQNKTENHEGDGENSGKSDGKSFIVTVIDRIKTLSTTSKDIVRHDADDNPDDLITKQEEEERKKAIAKEEKKEKEERTGGRRENAEAEE